MTHWKQLLDQGYSFPAISEMLYGDDADSTPSAFMAAWRASERRRG